MKIIYRTYLPGDEKGLVELFNVAFQTNGAGMLRVPSVDRWRYIDRPGFNPSEIQIAEDQTKNKIVGAIFSTIESHVIDSTTYKVGAINDVGVDPGYGKKGIARNLLNQAIKFMKFQGCELSVLCADPHGHAREKLYLKAGYIDYLKQISWVGFGNLGTLFKYLPIMAPIMPALLMHQGVLLLRKKFLDNKLTRAGYSIQIIHPPQSIAFSKYLFPVYKNTMIHQYDGFVEMSEPEWTHFRIKSPIKSFLPSYVIIRYKRKIIGFASFTRQFIYASKFGLRFPLAFMRDFLVDHNSVPDLTHLDFIYSALSTNLWYAFIGRKCMTGILNTTPHFQRINRAFQPIMTFKFASSTYMLKSFLPNNLIPVSKTKPYFISPGEFATNP